MTGLPVSADIVLNNTQVSDAGVYRCMVNNPPEAADPGIGELVLNVLGEYWIIKEALKVKVRVKAEIQHSAVLQSHPHCPSASGMEICSWEAASGSPALWQRGSPLRTSAGPRWPPRKSHFLSTGRVSVPQSLKPADFD